MSTKKPLVTEFVSDRNVAGKQKDTWRISKDELVRCGIESMDQLAAHLRESHHLNYDSIVPVRGKADCYEGTLNREQAVTFDELSQQRNSRRGSRSLG